MRKHIRQGKDSSERFWRGVYGERVVKGKMRVGGASQEKRKDNK